MQSAACLMCACMAATVPPEARRFGEHRGSPARHPADRGLGPSRHRFGDGRSRRDRPELTARLLALDEIRTAARFVVFGDRRILDAGARTAGVTLDLEVVTEEKAPGDRPVLVDLGNLDPAEVTPREATLAGGKFASENFRRALTLAAAGRADAVCFTPSTSRRCATPPPAMTMRSASSRTPSAGPAPPANSTSWTRSGTRGSPRTSRSPPWPRRSPRTASGPSWR